MSVEERAISYPIIELFEKTTGEPFTVEIFHESTTAWYGMTRPDCGRTVWVKTRWEEAPDGQ